MNFGFYDMEENILIERRAQFKYLSRILEETDSDFPTVHRNISKARSVWWRLENLLKREGVEIQVSDLFYRALIWAVLIFGSESWSLCWKLRR